MVNTLGPLQEEMHIDTAQRTQVFTIEKRNLDTALFHKNALKVLFSSSPTPNCYSLLCSMLVFKWSEAKYMVL